MPPPPAERPAGYRFGSFAIDLRAVRLLENGQPVHLEPRALQILLLLVEHPGELVTKDEFLEEVWHGAFVSDSALTRAMARLRLALGDEAQHPKYIETAPTLGYRFVAKVEPLSELAAGSAHSTGEAARQTRTRRRWWQIAVAGATILLVGLALSTLLRLWERALEEDDSGLSEDPLRIAVLPFENLGSPEDDYFADGMTEEITSRLAAVSGLQVISRTSSMQYKEDPPALRQIGEELGVDYVLEGTVRWAARSSEGPSRMRITPQLIRTTDDATLWAASYDRAVQDIFGIQSDIAARVVDRLGVTLVEKDRSELEAPPTDNLAAYQLYLRTLASQDSTQPFCEGTLRGQAYLEEAVVLDPSFAKAWSALAQLYSLSYVQCPERSAESAEKARMALARAEALAPESWGVVKARIRIIQQVDRDYPRALRLLQSVEARVAGDADLMMARGALLRRMGRWPEAIADFKRAFEVDPRSGTAALRIASANTYLRRYAEADDYYERMFVRHPENPWAYQRKAQNLWLWRGDLPAARQALGLYPAKPPALLRWAWFWQEIYEGRIAAALERLDEGDDDWLDTEIDIHPKTLLAAKAYDLLGDQDRARAAYEEALQSLQERMSDTSANDKLPRALGLTLAGLGRAEEAIAHGKRATELFPIATEPFFGSASMQRLALIYARLGRLEESLDMLDLLLAMPSLISVSLLELDPRWAPVRDHPRFKALKEKYGQAG
jgi:TolB-like protein/DNA-binding winged helix-turn-helix (wHTH) protein/Tfp pilus assembly protein PilF